MRLSKSILTLSALAFVLVLGCQSGEPEPTAAPKAESAKAARPKIEPQPGTKYYIGGPVLVKDKWGNTRIRRFNGEVLTPPSAGLVIAWSEPTPKTVVYETYVNGVKLAINEAKRDDKDLLWYTKQTSLDGGKVTVVETTEYDDAAEQYTKTTKFLDPDTGEVIKTDVSTLPYKAEYIETEDDEEEADEAEDGGTAARVSPSSAV